MGMGDRPGAVLFACGQNVIRSPMAAALAKSMFRATLYVESAGVKAGDADPFVEAVMQEIGIDMAGHNPKTFDQLEDDFFDLIVTLSPEAHHRALEMTRTMAVEVEYWPTMDPTLVRGSRTQIMDAYRQVRDGLLERIQKRFAGPGSPSG